jgi:hypothetical protein
MHITENQIFMACLDAHLYEIEYNCNITSGFYFSLNVYKIIIN